MNGILLKKLLEHLKTHFKNRSHFKTVINWREHIQRMDDNRLPKKKNSITNLKGEEI